MNAPLPIGQTLLAAGLIGEDQLRIALHEQHDRRQPQYSQIWDQTWLAFMRMWANTCESLMVAVMDERSSG